MTDAKRAIKTLRVRVKDKHACVLRKMAREVNQVFNFCNETSMRATRERREWLTGYDLCALTAGFSKCDGVTIGSGTVQRVCSEYARRRKQFKKFRLKWRVSDQYSSKFSLGWVPFKIGHVRYKAGQIEFAGHRFSLWDSYGLSKYELRSGSFSQDSRRRWYFNVAVVADVKPSSGILAIGVDLGLRTAITTSDGCTFDGRIYRASEPRLSSAQRARKKRLVKAIHGKIKNQRKDGLHKFSAALVKRSAAIFVGDVDSGKLVKTRMAKSVLDAGWAAFKTMLEYKASQAGVIFKVIDESYSTQACSRCGSIEGPKGVAGLGIRRWLCSCGVEHDRDMNAAQNIARRGLATLAEGALA